MRFALVLVVASVSALNLGLPDLAVSLNASNGDLTWIADGYTVALAWRQSCGPRKAGATTRSAFPSRLNGPAPVPGVKDAPRRFAMACGHPRPLAPVLVVGS